MKAAREGMNQWKSGFAVKTKARTLAEALDGADVFFGLSVKGAVTQDMVKSMADKPIIFAMANPDPEITVEDVAAVRSDAIMATGRSDYPNQINNVLGFPYIFRGALDVRARAINMEMKIAAAHALAAAGARGCARRGRGRLRRAAEIRAGLHHSGAVRSAADLVRFRRRSRRRRWTPKSHGGRLSTWTPIVQQLRSAARSDRRRACSACSRTCAGSRAASCSPRAKRSR